MGELFLYVDIDPDFIKLSTPMEKSLSPERTYRNYEFVRDMALIYRRARLPMRRLEVAPCSRKDPREALVQQCVLCLVLKGLEPNFVLLANKTHIGWRCDSGMFQYPRLQVASLVNCRGFPATILRRENTALQCGVTVVSGIIATTKRHERDVEVVLQHLRPAS